MRVSGIVCGFWLVAATVGAQGAVEGSLRLGILAAARGDLRGAEVQLRRALAVLEAADKDGSTQRWVETACALHVLGTLAQDAGRLEEAETFFRRAVSLAETHAGGRSWELAYGMGLLAQLRLLRGDVREAEHLAAGALRLGEKALGPHDPELARILTILADVRMSGRRPEEAEPLLRRADRLVALRGGSPALQLSVAVRRGALQMSLGRYHEAEPILERALELAEDALGSAHPQLSRVILPLAECYRVRNRLRDALALYERALALDETTYGSLHAALLPTLAGLARTAERLQDPRAASLYGRLAAVADSRLAVDDSQRAAYLDLCARFHERREASSARLTHLR